MKVAALLALASSAFAAVDGTVTNGTTNLPQAGVQVTAIKMGGSGPEPVESVKTDATGKFTLNAAVGDVPLMLQAAFDGVNYNKMLSPGMPSSGVNLVVYSSDNKPGTAKVTQHMILFEPVDGKLVVSENIIYQNSGTRSYTDSAGTLKFYLPPEAAGKVKVMGTAPQSVPVDRSAVETKTPNVYAVDFPIRPGETRFQLNYELPLSDPAVFKGKLMHSEGTTRLVTPKGVSLKGDGIEELGREPQTQAAIYELKKQSFELTVEGSGSLQAPAAASDEEGPGIQEILPRVYDKLPIVLGLSGAILAVGFAMLYRAQEAGKGKRKA